MSTNPIQFRLPVNVRGQVPDAVAEAIENHDDNITDLYQGFKALNAKVSANKAAVAATVTENVVSNSVTVYGSTPTIGFVNDQTGVTAYTTSQSDYGAFILLSDASAIAVTLAAAPIITLPFYTTFINSGAGTATLTPASGTIQGGASFSLLPNTIVTVAFDGTNFETASPVLPDSIAAVAHEWLNSYTAATGVFTAAQPAYSDISGTPVLPSDAPATAHEWVNSYTASTGAFTERQPSFSDISGTLAAGQLPVTGLTVTITTAALTTLGTQGSQTFVGGILTAQTQAT